MSYRRKPFHQSPKRKKISDRKKPAGWDSVSTWYDGMVGNEGSKFHKQQSIPETHRLLNITPGGRILDAGCGQGVLCESIIEKGGTYTGIDVSKKLIQMAILHHGSHGDFYHVDICNIPKDHRFAPESFDSIVFMLSIQDMRNFEQAIHAAAWALKNSGRLVFFMTHPAFRIPRQSGWGKDDQRKLMYRRIDSYLSSLDVPLRMNDHTQQTLTRSYHRPLQSYINAMAKNDLYIDVFRELPTYKVDVSNNYSKAELRAQREIPLFLAIRAMKRTV